MNTGVSGMARLDLVSNNSHSAIYLRDPRTNGGYLEMFWNYNATAANEYASIKVAGGTGNLVLQPNGGNVGIATTTPVIP